jgi:YVTN family beta-propeller protein
VIATVPLGKSPHEIAITLNGQHAYVANSYSNTVSMIATATNKVVATISGIAGGYGVGIVP